MKNKILILIIFVILIQFSYSQNTKTEEVITIEEYGSSLDEFDYARYIENRDINFLKSELGNTGVFHRIQNLGNRKYFCVYTVYILPNDTNQVTRNLSGLSVYSFEKWKEYEIQNEIERREIKSSLINNITELHPKLRELYKKYIDKIISNNRELALGYVYSFMKGNLLKDDRFFVKDEYMGKWDTSEYKVLPNDDFKKFIENSLNKIDSDNYEFQVDVVRGEETLINIPFIINNINEDWSNLNLQIGNHTVELNISDKSSNISLADKVKLIKKIKDDYNIIEVSYDNFNNPGLRNHIKKLQNSFDKLSSEFNELVSSEFNYFNYGSSAVRWYRGSGLFDTVDELKQFSENYKIIGLDFKFNPTRSGRLDLDQLKIISFLEVQLDDLKTRLKNDLKFHIKNEKVLNDVVDRCSNLMISNFLELKGSKLFFTEYAEYSEWDKYIKNQLPDNDTKLFELIKIYDSNKSKLTFEVINNKMVSIGNTSIRPSKDVREEGTNKWLGVLQADHYWWKIDFKEMKLELYATPGSASSKKAPFKDKLSSIDLN